MSKRSKTEMNKDVKKRRLNTHEENLTFKSALSKIQKADITWPENDTHELLHRMEENIPEDETLSYTARLTKLDWSNIIFKDYTEEECKEVWNTLNKPIRKFRYLHEIINDVKELISTYEEVGKTAMKPKQPKNNYMYFVEEKRNEVGKETGLTGVALVKKMGELFKMLTNEEKQKYNIKAQAARQEYDKEMQIYLSNHPNALKRTKRERNTVLEKPKKPFDLFFEAEQEKSESPKNILLQQCKEKWSKFTDKEKFFWINWAEERFHKYQDEVKEYMKENPDYVPEQITSVLSLKEKEIKELCSGKPQRPPFSAYHLYSKMIFDSSEVKDIDNKELINYISDKWKSCSNEEKNTYKKGLEQMWDEYEIKFEHYLSTLPPNERDEIREKEFRRKPKFKKENVTEKKTQVKLPKPKTPPVTDFEYFVQKYKGEDDPTVVWEQMSSDEKDEYKKNLYQEKKVYIAEYERYLNSLSKKELTKLSCHLKNQYSSSESEEED